MKDIPKTTIYGWNGDIILLQVLEDFSVATSRGKIIIPERFITDGLSIPRFAWAIVGPTTGKAFVAGLLHDYLYSKVSPHDFSRQVADGLFLEAMFNLGVGFRRNLIYAAVRAAGWRYYKKR